MWQDEAALTGTVFRDVSQGASPHAHLLILIDNSQACLGASPLHRVVRFHSTPYTLVPHFLLNPLAAQQAPLMGRTLPG
jgi:hypothetical protein